MFNSEFWCGMTTKQRDNHVDTIRGISCLLLVVWHVIGDSSTTGLHVAPHSYWRYFADIFIYFRLPMFAFVSGYVYGKRPFEGDARRFLTGKARRLLLPMFVVEIFSLLLKAWSSIRT
jgi:fucose 4-O-acetylase-like acetyltransferase